MIVLSLPTQNNFLATNFDMLYIEKEKTNQIILKYTYRFTKLIYSIYFILIDKNIFFSQYP